MAWEKGTSARASRLPPNWQSLRLRVLRRDRYQCQHRDYPGAPICGGRANQVDHIERGDDHSVSNLQALCQHHHAAKSSREGVEARQAKGSTRRPPEPHPAERIAKQRGDRWGPSDPWGVTP